jgi:hypothetical protein
MRALITLTALTVLTCGHPQERFRGSMADAAPKPGTTDDHPRCVAALRALADGKLANWQGLTARCARADAETALGPATGDDQVGDLGGTPTPYRSYPATAGAPEGILVWFRDQRIVLVRVAHPVLGEALETSLGVPEAKERSLLASGHTQWIYASRGVVGHVWGTDTTKLFHLYAFQPMSVDEFRGSWLSKLEIRRIRQPR